MADKAADSRNSSFTPRSRLMYIGLILGVAVFLRVLGLSWSLPDKYHVTTYNCDEYTLLTSLQVMDPARLNFNPISKKDPLALASGTFHLYSYAVLIKTLAIAGWLPLTHDKDFYYQNPREWGKFFLAGRLLSVFYGVLTVWLIYLLAGKMYGRRAGLLAALFVACMPAHVMYSRYMLGNVPGVFWIVLAFYFLKNVIDAGRTRDYVLAGMSAGAAISTRYSAAPLVPMLLLAHFMTPSPFKTVKKPALGLLALFFLFIASSPYTILDFRNFLKGLFFIKGLATGAAHKFMLFKSLTDISMELTDAFGMLLLLLCLAGIAVSLYKRKRDDILLLSWVLPLLMIFIKAGAVSSAGRMLPALPFLAVLGARGLDLAWDWKPMAAKIALVSVLASAVLFYGAAFRLILAPDIRTIASAWMADNVKPGSSIGLIREPSWFSPGIIDRKYRHPDHRQLPDYAFIPLAEGDFTSAIGFERLGAVKPDFVIASDFEIESLPKPYFLKMLDSSGYRKIKEFRNSFAFLNLSAGKKIPEMCFIPDYISVFAKDSPSAPWPAIKGK